MKIGIILMKIAMDRMKFCKRIGINKISLTWFLSVALEMMDSCCVLSNWRIMANAPEACILPTAISSRIEA